MPPTSNEDQFKFLISCIRYSNNGKVDFTQVATECNIVSKGAAAKRYERMMKAHGIAPNAATTKAPPMMMTPRATPVSRTTSASAKKRKLDAFANDERIQDDDDDEEDDNPFGHTTKTEPGVKEELANSSHVDSAVNSPYISAPMLSMPPHGMSPSSRMTPYNTNNYGQMPQISSFNNNDMYVANHNDYTDEVDLFGMEAPRSYNGVGPAGMSGYGSYRYDTPSSE